MLKSKFLINDQERKYFCSSFAKRTKIRMNKLIKGEFCIDSRSVRIHKIVLACIDDIAKGNILPTHVRVDDTPSNSEFTTSYR